MKNLDDILKMAGNVQAELQKAQESLDNIEVEGAAGGGLVKIRASAKRRKYSGDERRTSCPAGASAISTRR